MRVEGEKVAQCPSGQGHSTEAAGGNAQFKRDDWANAGDAAPCTFHLLGTPRMCTAGMYSIKARTMAVLGLMRL